MSLRAIENYLQRGRIERFPILRPNRAWTPWSPLHGRNDNALCHGWIRLSDLANGDHQDGTVYPERVFVLLHAYQSGIRWANGRWITASGQELVEGQEVYFFMFPTDQLDLRIARPRFTALNVDLRRRRHRVIENRLDVARHRPCGTFLAWNM